jgi:cell wall-associated NlpC family hydrolase
MGSRRSAQPWGEGALRRIRRHLTFANVALAIALFVALGGGTAIALNGTNAVQSEPAPRTTEAVAAAADQLDAMDVPYVSGGGHEITPTVADEGLDCSSAVSWVLQHAGFHIDTASTSTVTTKWSAILEPWDPSQRGVFVVNHPDPDGAGGRTGHVFLVIDGRIFQSTSLNDDGATWAGPYTISRGSFTEHTHDYVVWHVRGTGVAPQPSPAT